MNFNDTIEALVQEACQQAARGAADYLNRLGLEADPAALAANLKARVKAALPSALDDAKEAIGCGMTEAAVLTFGLSMRQAGIDAAKESVKAREPMSAAEHAASPRGRWS